MIQVTKNYTVVPEKLNYVKEPLLSAYADLLIKKNKHLFKTNIYRKGSIDKLKKIYHNKCGYCETVTAAGAELRVDHYRPKDKIKEDINHMTGYYWLAYEWSNLILACEKCNRAKSNRFPIDFRGARCYSPILISGTSELDKTTFSAKHYSLKAERPLIVNPEVDRNLTKWFVFLPNGEMREINDNLRIKETIKVCKLNREPLVLDRKKILDDIVMKVEKYIDDYIFDKDNPKLKTRIYDLLDDLLLKTDTKNKYSRFSYFLYLKFPLFIGNKFDSKSKALIVSSYKAHLSVSNL